MIDNESNQKKRATPIRTRGGPEAVDVHVGGRVRQRRTMLGMSQEKLGEALGPQRLAQFFLTHSQHSSALAYASAYMNIHRFGAASGPNWRGTFLLIAFVVDHLLFCEWFANT